MTPQDMYHLNSPSHTSRNNAARPSEGDDLDDLVEVTI